MIWTNPSLYCKFENFRDNSIFENSVKTHICEVKNLQQGRDLHISVKDREISPIREDFIFMKLRTKIKPSLKFSEFTVSNK